MNTGVLRTAGLGLLLVLGLSLAWADSSTTTSTTTTDIPLTPNSVTVRGNFSHSAFINGPVTQTVRPGSVFHVPPSGHGVPVFFFRGYHVHGPLCRYYEPGYRYEERQVWVPGYWTTRYVSPKYAPREKNGLVEWYLVSRGYHEPVWVEGHYEWRRVAVQVPAYWSCGYA